MGDLTWKGKTKEKQTIIIDHCDSTPQMFVLNRALTLLVIWRSYGTWIMYAKFYFRWQYLIDTKHSPSRQLTFQLAFPIVKRVNVFLSQFPRIYLIDNCCNTRCLVYLFWVLFYLQAFWCVLLVYCFFQYNAIITANNRVCKEFTLVQW